MGPGLQNSAPPNHLGGAERLLALCTIEGPILTGQVSETGLSFGSGFGIAGLAQVN